MARNPINGAQRETKLVGGVIGRGRQHKRATRETSACGSYADSSFVLCSRSPIPAGLLGCWGLTDLALVQACSRLRSCASNLRGPRCEWSCRRRPGIRPSCSHSPREAATQRWRRAGSTTCHPGPASPGRRDQLHIGQVLLCFRTRFGPCDWVCGHEGWLNKVNHFVLLILVQRMLLVYYSVPTRRRYGPGPGVSKGGDFWVFLLLVAHLLLSPVLAAL